MSETTITRVDEIANSRDYFLIVNEHTGKCLTVEDFAQNDGAHIVQSLPTGSGNQQWLLLRNSDGYYEVVAKHSGKCLDDAKNSRAKGGVAHQWTRCNGWNQHWQLVMSVDGVCYFVSRIGKMNLDANLDGYRLHVWTPHQGSTQKWRLKKQPTAVDELNSLLGLQSVKAIISQLVNYEDRDGKESKWD